VHGSTRFSVVSVTSTLVAQNWDSGEILRFLRFERLWNSKASHAEDGTQTGKLCWAVTFLCFFLIHAEHENGGVGKC